MNEEPTGIIQLPRGLSSEEASGFAKAFADTMASNPPMTILHGGFKVTQLSEGHYIQGKESDGIERIRGPYASMADVYTDVDLIGHDGHCGPRYRPLRALFGLTARKFKSCPYDYGATGFCERRYVWDAGQWRRVLSERQIRRLEGELGINESANHC